MEAFLRDVTSDLQRADLAVKAVEQRPGLPAAALRARVQAVRSQFLLSAAPVIMSPECTEREGRAMQKLSLVLPVADECHRICQDAARALGGHGAAATQTRAVARGAQPPERQLALMEGRMCPDCFRDTDVLPARSETRCPQCARVFEIGGIVFEECQSYSQDGQKIKSGHFDAVKHWRDWEGSILGEEPVVKLGGKGDEYGTLVLEKLRAVRPRYRAFAAQLTVGDVRSMLAEIKRTDLNPHVTLIVKQLSGRGPPLPTEDQRRRAALIFEKVLEVRETLSFVRINRNYYPYYFYKIYDFILPAQDPARGILKYVHLQGEDTLRANDAEWREICLRIPRLTWRATRRA